MVFMSRLRESPHAYAAVKWETRDPKSREGFVWPWKRTSLYSSSPSVFCGTLLAASVKLEATVLSIQIGLIGNVLPIIAHCHLPVVGSSNDPAQNKSLIKTCLDSLGLFLISFSLFCVTWTVRVRWCSPSGWPAVAPRLPWSLELSNRPGPAAHLIPLVVPRQVPTILVSDFHIRQVQPTIYSQYH